jgi:alkylhydroperoxidase family enzyme
MKRRKLLLGVTIAIAVLLVIAAAVELSIRTFASRMGVIAMERFPGDRVSALVRYVECTDCDLRMRNHAVWALGQAHRGDPRAAAVLRKHFTAARCDHNRDLCQYELSKAVRLAQGR